MAKHDTKTLAEKLLARKETAEALGCLNRLIEEQGFDPVSDNGQSFEAVWFD